MFRQNRAFWLLAVLAIVAAAGYRAYVTRTPAVITPKLMFVTGGSGPYWQTTVDGAKAAAKELAVDLQVEMPAEEESLQQQTEILTRAEAAKVGGIAVSPLDAEGQTHVINQMVRNSYVVTFDSDAPLSDRLGFVGTNNFSAGGVCARMVNEALPNGGKVVVLMANMTKDNLLDRKNGFQERMAQYADDVEASKPPKYEIVGFLVDEGNSEKCAQNIRDILKQHPDLACFVGLNSLHGPTLLKVLQEENKLGKVQLVTFDVEAETLDGIEAGHIFASIAQDPYNFGFEAVRMLSELCRGKTVNLPIVGKGSIYLGAEPIRKENLQDFRTRLSSRVKAAS